MSKLGKILFYIALAGGVAAAIAGWLIIQKRAEDKANLVQTQQAKDLADKATAKAKAETDAVTAAKADSDQKLTAATTQVADLGTQLTEAKKQASDAAGALDTANAAAKAAQDNLDKLKTAFGDKAPEQIKADQDNQSEQKILQDQLQASQTQITDLKDAINRAKIGTMPPGISGKVTFVNSTWNFVVLNVGLSSGVVPNGELIVYRGKSFLGKIKVTTVEANSAVADILPDLKGNIQVGDYVLN